MAKEQDFTNREILLMFGHIREELAAIKEQTTKTNGRVTKAADDIVDLQREHDKFKAVVKTLGTVATAVWAFVTFVTPLIFK